MKRCVPVEGEAGTEGARSLPLLLKVFLEKTFDERKRRGETPGSCGSCISVNAFVRLRHKRVLCHP